MLQSVTCCIQGMEKHTDSMQKKPQDVLFCCDKCGSEAVDMMQCKSCKKVRYCSRDCQKQDWQCHRTACRHFKSLMGGVVLRLHKCIALPPAGDDHALLMNEMQVSNTELHFAALELSGNKKIEALKKIVETRKVERDKWLVRKDWRGFFGAGCSEHAISIIFFQMKDMLSCKKHAWRAVKHMEAVDKIMHGAGAPAIKEKEKQEVETVRTVSTKVYNKCVAFLEMDDIESDMDILDQKFENKEEGYVTAGLEIVKRLENQYKLWAEIGLVEECSRCLEVEIKTIKVLWTVALFSKCEDYDTSLLNASIERLWKHMKNAKKISAEHIPTKMETLKEMEIKMVAFTLQMLSE